MRYRAPEGVTAVFLAGEVVTPDQAGFFEAGAEAAEELAAHGCVAVTGDDEPTSAPAADKSSRGRSRVEKAG